MRRHLTMNRQKVLMKIEGVLKYETQSDSQCGASGHVNLWLCLFRRAPALQQLEPVKLHAEQGPETEKQEREKDRHKARAAAGNNHFLDLRVKQFLLKTGAAVAVTKNSSTAAARCEFPLRPTFEMFFFAVCFPALIIAYNFCSDSSCPAHRH
jgi:hypothetical protein